MKNKLKNYELEYIFLVCTERSGSNFITSLMNGHSAICGPPPTHLFRLFATNMDRYGNLDDDAAWSDLVGDLSNAFHSTLGVWNTSISAKEILLNVKNRSLTSILKYIYGKEAVTDDAQFIFVKENQTAKFSPFLLANFPECKFLAAVRDPRDVALSWVNAAAMPGGIQRAVDTWIRDQTAALSLYSQLKDSKRCRLIHYEALLADVRGTLEPILEWMGLGFDESILRHHENPRTKRNAQRIAGWKHIASGVLEKNSSKFRSGLSSEEIRYIELRCAPLMAIFGYETEQIERNRSSEIVAEEIATLEKGLRVQAMQIGGEEATIRRRRLESIARVLDRSKKCVGKPIKT